MTTVNDIFNVMKFYEENFEPPEKWWSEVYLRIYSCKKRVIEDLMNYLLNSSPENCFEDTIVSFMLHYDSCRKDLTLKHDKRLQYSNCYNVMLSLMRYLENLGYVFMIFPFPEPEYDDLNDCWEH